MFCYVSFFSEELLANLEEAELLVGDTIAEVREDIPQVRGGGVEIMNKWLFPGCDMSKCFFTFKYSYLYTCTTVNREIFTVKIVS